MNYKNDVKIAQNVFATSNTWQQSLLQLHELITYNMFALWKKLQMEAGCPAVQYSHIVS